MAVAWLESLSCESTLGHVSKDQQRRGQSSDDPLVERCQLLDPKGPPVGSQMPSMRNCHGHAGKGEALRHSFCSQKPGQKPFAKWNVMTALLAHGLVMQVK